MTSPTNTDVPTEGGTQDPAPEAPGEDAKTFTQADLDAKINERLARERKKFADYDTLKQRASEYDALAAASMTAEERAVAERERAVAEAVAKKEDEVTLRYAGRLVEESIRAATAGRLETSQVDALLEGVDRSRFLTEDGDVDRKALTTWVDLIAPATASGPPDLGQGARGVAAAGVDMNQILRSAAGRS